MTAWWESLSTILQIFYGIALLGSLLLAIQSILLLIGSGHADLGDAHVDSHPGGLGMLSIRTVMAFFTGFGWVGVIATKQGAGLPVAIILGLITGGVLAWSLLWLMRSMRGLASDGSLDYANAVGAIATVIVAIQPEGRSGGQVEVMVQGRLAAVQAIGTTAAAIPSGSKVRVAELVGSTTLRVTPL
jgi:hypothetical protein